MYSNASFENFYQGSNMSSIEANRLQFVMKHFTLSTDQYVERIILFSFFISTFLSN
jgi:hypothetical protein